DVDGDGLIGGSEVGIPGVSVSLYRDANNDGEPDGAAISTESTDANGYYLFDGLTQGNYLVGVDASNFDPGGPLEGRASTLSAVDDNPADAIPPEDVDSNDNRTTPARLDMINTTYGFVSDTIALTVGGEPTGETDLSGNTALDGPNSIGNSGETDANSNITVDFGFYQSIAIGNRVWFDPNDNGIIDTGEQGISGVDVTLYRDSNSDGVPDDIDGNGTFGDAGDGLQTDTTDSNGYYLFNNVSPGNYIVGVDGSNFNAGNVLSGSASSSGSAVTAVDSNDNGIDTADGQGNILSNTIVVTANNTPSGETDTSGDIADGPNFRGINNESDNNSDITIDFGFVANPMSIGNRVWLDDGSGGGTSNNGQIDGGEQGISGVTMQLFADADGDGQPDSGIPVATDTTDANGYYLFDGIPPGRYVVQVAPLNFIGGGALDGVFSSAGNGPAGTSSRDQGIDDNDPSANGILSGSILLEQNNAPTTADEDDLSGNAADGPDSRGNNGETDNNSDLTVDFGFTAVFDWSDAPDSYGTTSGSDGARHRIISTLFMGDEIDDETDGQPNTGADGDDNNGTSSDDEDGVRIEDFVAGTSTTVEVSVFNDTGQDATLIVWIDWDGDGTFDSGEGSSVTVPPDNSTQAVQVPVTVPLTADVDTGGTTYLRARLTTDNITVNNPTGAADSGEVEDYVVNVLPPGLAISKTDAFNSIVAGQATTYTITINNSGTDALNRQFVDDVPAEYENVTWTCTATNGASCIAGDAAGTGDTGTGDIDTLIDIPRDGQIVFTIDATLNANTTNTTLVNTATVINGPSSTDTNGVIFDPPTGSKIGVVEGDTLIRWTQEWINSGGAAQAATITDDLPSDQTFAGNLVCSAQGTSTTTSCTENNGTITWTGTIFPGNANTVLISFNVTVAGAGTYTNTASLTDGTTVTSASDTVTINQDGTSNNDDDDDGGICCPTATPTPGPTLTPIPGAVQDPFLDVLELPATGEKPWWNMPLLVTLWAIAAAAVLSGVAAVVRRLRHRE
ncbi:MAG: SdrD B-like domain-containing protein, partial [Chloroflexota bacterium]